MRILLLAPHPFYQERGTPIAVDLLVRALAERGETVDLPYELYQQMKKNNDIWVVTADLGYGMFDSIRNDFPERFLNTGAAEQAAMGIAVGLAEQGKIPFIYSITPFLLYRAFETIRNYIDHEKIPVKLIGGGRDCDYKHDGFSHWAEEDKDIMRNFRNIWSRWPATKEEIPMLVRQMIATDNPFYVNSHFTSGKAIRIKTDLDF